MASNSLLNDFDEKGMKDLFEKAKNIHLHALEISDFLEGKADSFTRIRVEAHMERCSLCSEDIEMLKDLREKDTGKFNVELADKFWKVMAFQKPRHSKVDREAFSKREFSFGFLSSAYACIGIHAKTSSGWAERLLGKDVSGSWSWREDTKGNLEFDFRVDFPAPKSILIKTEKKTWEEPLKREGDTWAARLVIPVEERRDFQNIDDIRISVIA